MAKIATVILIIIMVFVTIWTHFSQLPDEEEILEKWNQIDSNKSEIQIDVEI